MAATAPAQPPTFYRPAEVAAILRCSVWWVKEQARQRRIPYCWIGGSYLFTEEHIAEIIRRFEVSPVDVADPVPATRLQDTKPSTTRSAESPIRLQARVPRRAREAAAKQPAA